MAIETQYTAEEAAKVLRCSRLTIIRRIKSGALRGARNGNGRTPYLIPESAIQEYLEEQQRKFQDAN